MGILDSCELLGSILRLISPTHQIWQNQLAFVGQPPAILCQNIALAQHNQQFPRTAAIYPNTMLTGIGLLLGNCN
jgi:hypothetical protein